MSTAQRQARRLPIPAAWPVRSHPAAHPWAIISAGLAPSLLTGAYLTAGILQPASYSPVRTTISVMAGQAGTDRWVMTGGIVLVSGSLHGVAAAIRLSRATMRTIRQNLFFAFLYNVLAIPLAALGLLNPLIAAAAMAFSDVSVLGNALLLRRTKID